MVRYSPMFALINKDSYGSVNRGNKFGINGAKKITKKSEMHIAAFVSDHNLSYNLMNHFVQLLPKLYPDSEVARNIKCKRTKCSALVNNMNLPIEAAQSTYV
ncbi:hypothetical protein NQ318_023251 [Aromia moschata]|uniref:Uncharacterized protein n=1 Tax=Aromia moschata TaxID=1265417 RepID=A0AAV8XMQ8_9CUCU|nr:hypothetical protein NQ318_023251 [Aromia moschata]